MTTDLLAGAEGVLFDLDDTLIDYSYARDSAVTTWAAAHGSTLAGAELVQRWRELEEEHFPRYQTGELTMTEQRRERVRGLPGWASLSDADAEERFGTFMALAEAGWRPLPGAAAAVRTVACRARVGVLTNGSPEVQLRKLTLLGLADLPMFASGATGLPKPRPEAFHGACRALGLRPEATVMVGDNLDVDVRGALAAGLRAIWVNAGARPGPAGVPSVRSVAELA